MTIPEAIRTPPCRILYVHNSADIYGASRSLLRLLSRLPRDRFLPVAMLPEEGPLRSRLEALGVQTLVEPRLAVIARSARRLPKLLGFGLRFPTSVLAVCRHIRRLKIDLVHTNTGVVVSSGLAARLTRRPHVWHIRDWFQEFGHIWPAYAAYIRWSSSYVLAVSGPVAGQFTDRRKVLVIHNGVALEDFDLDRADARRTFRRRFGLGGEFVVGCVGRIKLIRKGQEILIKAAALLEAQGRHARYVIIGSPSPGSEDHLAVLERQIDDLGLRNRFTLAGELPDTRLAYPAFDVLALTSVQPEPFAGVVIEAMASGVPVIATRIGGSLEQVADSVTGFLVEPGSPQALATAIARLMDDPALCARLGAAGRRRVAEAFSLDRMVDKIAEVYERALQPRD